MWIYALRNIHQQMESSPQISGNDTNLTIMFVNIQNKQILKD